MKKRCLLLIGILCISFSGCKKEENLVLYPFKHLEIKETGWQKSGKLKIMSHTIDYTGDDETVFKFIDSIEFHIKNNKELKNGDKVKIYVTYNEDYKQLSNISLNKTEYTYKVHKLRKNNKKVKTITEKKKDETTGEMVDVADQIITIDGVDIPASWNLSNEEMQDYVDYVKNSEDGSTTTSDETGVEDHWIQGESETKTNRKSAKYYTKDYNNSDTGCYHAAYEYGSSSSQKFKVNPILEDQKVVGYECVFKED